eukprot:scaffold106497_cov15-Tisochrysis_lutea.AAC.2
MLLLLLLLLLQDHIDNKEKMDAELASLKAEIEQLKVEFDHKLMCVLTGRVRLMQLPVVKEEKSTRRQGLGMVRQEGAHPCHPPFKAFKLDCTLSTLSLKVACTLSTLNLSAAAPLTLTVKWTGSTSRSVNSGCKRQLPIAPHPKCPLLDCCCPPSFAVMWTGSTSRTVKSGSERQLPR